MADTLQPSATVTHARDVYSAVEMDAFRGSGLWRDVVLTDLLAQHAVERPDETAVVAESSRRTWSQLADDVDRLAASLLGIGLMPGDFVAIQLPNTLEFVQTYLAVQRAGLRALTMLSIYREKDVTFMMRKCGAKAYVIPAVHRGHDFVAMARRVRPDVDSLAHVVVAGGGDAPDARRLDDLLGGTPLSSDEYAGLRPDPDSISKVSFTSGTTGFPKGVAHTHNTDLVPPILMQQAVGLGPHTPIWMPSPIAHVTGLLFGVYGSLLNGAKLVLQDAWDPVRALELVSEERAVVTVSATPFIAGMLDVPNVADYDLSRFEYFLSGGARIPSVLVERAKQEMGTYLLRVFGSAEAPLHTANLPGDSWTKLTGRDGRPFSGIESRVVDPDDRTRVLGPGQQGEYATRGPHVFLGYYADPELTDEVRDVAGWYYSGDLCEIDEDGYVLYVDRIKDIVNRGGIKISALEVENELVTHPAIRAAAVVAVPDDRLGERTCAFVILRDSAVPVTLEALGSYLEKRGVTRQKWPELLRTVDEFPTTATGKIRKVELRDSVVG